jgi:serine/threonine-protein kinase HipA
MDVMGEALEIDRDAMLRLAGEAEVSVETAGGIIDKICNVASQFATIAENLYPRVITQDTLDTIQGRIDENIDQLR